MTTMTHYDGGGTMWVGYPIFGGTLKMAGSLLAVAATAVGVGFTLSNWAQILGSLASILLTLSAAAVLLIKLRRPRTFAKPEKPPADAPVRVWEAYYRADEAYNRAIEDNQP